MADGGSLLRSVRPGDLPSTELYKGTPDSLARLGQYENTRTEIGEH